MKQCIENEGFFESKDDCDKIPTTPTTKDAFDTIAYVSSSEDGRYIAYVGYNSLYLYKYNNRVWTTIPLNYNLQGNNTNNCFLSKDGSILAVGIPLKNKIITYNTQNGSLTTTLTIPETTKFGQQIYIDNNSNLIVKCNNQEETAYYKYTYTHPPTATTPPYDNNTHKLLDIMYTVEYVDNIGNRNMISYEKNEIDITVFGFNNKSMYINTSGSGGKVIDYPNNFYNISASTGLNVIATSGYTNSDVLDIYIYRDIIIEKPTETISIERVANPIFTTSSVLSLSDDGNTLLVSEYYNSSVIDADTNNIWLCKYNNVSRLWNKEKISFSVEYESTNAISLSGDGRIAVIGFPKKKIIKIISTF